MKNILGLYYNAFLLLLNDQWSVNWSIQFDGLNFSIVWLHSCLDCSIKKLCIIYNSIQQEKVLGLSKKAHLEHDLVLGLLAGAALRLDLVALLLLILLLAQPHAEPTIILTPDITKRKEWTSWSECLLKKLLIFQDCGVEVDTARPLPRGSPHHTHLG